MQLVPCHCQMAKKFENQLNKGTKKFLEVALAKLYYIFIYMAAMKLPVATHNCR